MRHQLLHITLLSLLVTILTGCHTAPTNVSENNELPDIYPDYVNVTIPVGIAPLNFSMADDKVETIDIEATLPISISTSGTNCCRPTRVEN